jgi:D-sedoheptulose 7-phosphate isomerase
VFICRNGGSAGNAIHLTNDFLYGIAKHAGGGIKTHVLSYNRAVITSLANDVGYDHICSESLVVLGQPSGFLVVLAGSSNSPNI